MQRELTQLLYPSAVHRSLRRPRDLASGRILLGTAAIVMTAVAAWLAVRATGGSPNTLNHLGYGAVILGAFLFGWRGALPAAVFTGLLLGPAAGVVPGQEESFNSWFPRLVMFVGVGAVVGSLFDLSRHSTDGWKQAAAVIAGRERDGMVALARGAEAKDTDTGEHIQRVRLVSEELAIATGLSTEEGAALGWAAMLHDVGKLHVPDRILLKPGPLTPEEWEIMRQHPIYGEQILADGPAFATARRVARWHHENFDGSGYPDGLRGERIPLEARIVRIADALDAMTHDRPYKRGESFEWALEELRRCEGSDFDPELVRVLTDVVGRNATLVRSLSKRLQTGGASVRAP